MTKERLKISIFFSLFILTVITFTTFQAEASTSEIEVMIKEHKCKEAWPLIQKENEGPRAFHSGECYNLANEFEKAKEQLLKAYYFYKGKEKDKQRPPALLFSLGHAFYGNNKLKEARKAYLRSAKQGYQKQTSHYFVAYISVVLEDYKNAIKYFQVLKTDPETPHQLLQIALFQLGESYLNEAEERKADTPQYVKARVVPYLEQSVSLDKKSKVGLDASKRLHEVLTKYRLDPNIMITGKKIPEKRYQVFLTQNITYDNNMTLATDLPTLQATSKDSYIFKTTAQAGYQFYHQQRYTLVPALTLNLTRHTDQDSSSVYQNDGHDYTLALKTRTEHFAFDKPAGLGLDLDYNKVEKDYRGIHDPEYFSKAYSISVSDSFSYFKLGGSVVSYKFRKSSSYTAAQDNSSQTLTLVQTHVRPNQHLMIFLFMGTFTRLPNTPTSDTDSYLMRMDYIIPEIMPKYILNPSMTMTFLDTKQQKATRGIEKTYNPVIKLVRKSGDHLQTSIFYSYTNNQSKNEAANEYEKTQYGFEMKYIF